jgi:glutamyl-tRNA synthetase
LTVRVRFPPSPTGYLHVGGARTALFNWLYARRYGGQFVLRIEDTDRRRYVEDAVTGILDSLRWLGLDWDEGPDVGGPYSPYFQSQRLPIYQEHAANLVARGHAYECYCSKERLAALREHSKVRGEASGYDRHCRNLTSAERAEFKAQGIIPVVRLAVPLEGETTFHDRIYGDITCQHANIMRGDDWLPSVPLHVLLYQAFGWEMPVLAHLPLILDPSGKGKMSKRKTISAAGREYPVRVLEFRDAGYLPEAVFNFLALIGWAYDEKTEILTREQMIEAFDLSGIKKSPGAFSYEKLDWMNGVYIRMLDPDDLAQRLMPFFLEAGFDADLPTIRRLVPLIQERLKTLAEAPELVDFLFVQEIDFDLADLIPKKATAEETARLLTAAHNRLVTLEPFEDAALETSLRGLADELGVKAGTLFSPIRVAVTGKTVAPPLFGTLALLGRERAVQRMDRALARLAE